MEQFIKKNSYAILITLFDDNSFWTNEVSADDFWNEFKETLLSLPKIYRLSIPLGILLLSLVPPPYSFFSILYRSPLSVRKKWLDSWAHSKWTWRNSMLLGIRILILGSALQLPQTMANTNYQAILEAREEHHCLRMNQTEHE
ncbi:MAG TPA: hypothetical protein PLX23_00305 [Candidatus Hydrogenedens sp.]|nr:hypothetical protein [Candidatus Hydrogenedens sp.]